MGRRSVPGPSAHSNVAHASFGDPEPWGAISIVYRAEDLRRAAGVWRFGPGAFDYEANHDELLYIIDGGLTVRLGDGEALALGAGDLAYLPGSVQARWETHSTVRAVFCSVAEHEPLDY